MYNNLKKNLNPIVKIENKISFNFLDGAFVEITGNNSASYLVKFINDDTENVVYETTINNNCWARTSIKYFIKWRIEVYQKDSLIFQHIYTPKNKTVFISFESSSLGDTIAWIPYALEFKKKNNCHVIISTFHNYLFKNTYPELEFVIPGSVVDNIYAKYNLGWFYDLSKEPISPNLIPLQKTATNILGLEYREIKPIVYYQVTDSPTTNKYVTIATNSTAGCKFWTKEGWQEVINYLVSEGYSVINVSKERNPFDNCIQLEDVSMKNTINTIHYSEFFIGLSSGLSWLAWAMNRQVVMIANFSEKGHEFECIRITDTSLCHGCWNKAEHKFDRGDWNWCPLHKNTPRQFECHRGIGVNKVLEAIQPLLLL